METNNENVNGDKSLKNRKKLIPIVLLVVIILLVILAIIVVQNVTRSSDKQEEKDVEDKTEEDKTEGNLLYDVLQTAAKENKYAKEYTGAHQDSMDGNGKEKIYHWYASDDESIYTISNKNNVVFAGQCWQMIRTTDTGGVKMIYNGTSKDYYENERIEESEYINVTNDLSYQYTFDSTTKKWTSTNKTDSTTSTITFSVKTSGDYAINYNVSSESNRDKVYIYKDGTQIGVFSGEKIGNINLGKIDSTNVIMVKYTKDDNASIGSDSVEFSLGVKNGSIRQICTNNGLESQIGMSDFNSSADSLAYVGYMYNPTSATNYISKFKVYDYETGNYKYGTSFTYTDGKYKLKEENIKEFSDWRANYNKMDNNHYTCFNETGECTTISYIHNTNDSIAYYINLTGGKSIEDALNEMLWNDDVNVKDSTIKEEIDSWYEENIKDYSDYLEDTIFCNDRSVINLNGWNPNEGNMKKNLQFKDYNMNSDLSCKNVTDRFSVSNPKAKLKYKVGLMSNPEMNLLNNNTVRHTKEWYWLSSPFEFDVYYATNRYVNVDGTLNSVFVYFKGGVRPAVSLKTGTKYISGDGSKENPYVVD